MSVGGRRRFMADDMSVAAVVVVVHCSLREQRPTVRRAEGSFGLDLSPPVGSPAACLRLLPVPSAVLFPAAMPDVYVALKKTEAACLILLPPQQNAQAIGREECCHQLNLDRCYGSFSQCKARNIWKERCMRCDGVI